MKRAAEAYQAENGIVLVRAKTGELAPFISADLIIDALRYAGMGPGAPAAVLRKVDDAMREFTRTTR